mgnify:CR=1 FL=1
MRIIEDGCDGGDDDDDDEGGQYPVIYRSFVDLVHVHPLPQA